MAPDPLYVATVAENIRSSLRTTDDPDEVRRYLYELRDTLYESEFDGEPYTEMLDVLESHLDRLEQEALGSIGETRRERIIDEVHRIERFCQRQQDNGDSKSTDDGNVTKMGNDITINIGDNGEVDGSSIGATSGSNDLWPSNAWDNVEVLEGEKANTSGEDTFSDVEVLEGDKNITPKT
jgi:hypothetical protein